MSYGTSITAKVDLNISVYCKCGTVLNVIETDESRSGAVLTIEPCASCVDEAIQKWQADQN